MSFWDILADRRQDEKRKKQVMKLASSERRTKKIVRGAHEISQAVWRGCAKVSLLTRSVCRQSYKINAWRRAAERMPEFSFERSVF